MKTIGTIALALIGIGLVSNPADAGKKKSKKKKAHAAAVVVAEEAPRQIGSLGLGVKLATPTGVVKKTVVIDENAMLAAGDSFDLGRTEHAADMPTGDDAMRLQGVRLTTADAGEVVKGNWDDIDYCWSRVPAKLRDQGVETSLTFTVDPRGKVLAVTVDGSTPGKFAVCMKLAAKRWNFPIADGESVVEYPLSLH